MARGGDVVTLTWRVRNAGDAVTNVDSWRDAIYLSADDVLRFARARRAAGAGPVTIGADLSYLGTILRTARALWRMQVTDEPVRQARDGLALRVQQGAAAMKA